MAQKKLSEEELSSLLSQKFSSIVEEESKNPISEEEEKHFFDGVLKLHPNRMQTREELAASFKDMMKQMDPDIPFYYDYQRPDYSVVMIDEC